MIVQLKTKPLQIILANILLLVCMRAGQVAWGFGYLGGEFDSPLHFLWAEPALVMLNDLSKRKEKEMFIPDYVGYKNIHLLSTFQCYLFSVTNLAGVLGCL